MMRLYRVQIYLGATLILLAFPSVGQSAISETSDVMNNIRGGSRTFYAAGGSIDTNKNSQHSTNDVTPPISMAIANIQHTIGAGDDTNGEDEASCRTLYTFRGDPPYGVDPRGALIQAAQGEFYGAAFSGGRFSRGMIFKITSAGVESVLYSFKANNGDGSHPSAGLIQSSDGSFYGTTLYGGMWGGGTVFKITPTGTETVLLSFGSSLYKPSDGLMPDASLIQAKDGDFYGITNGGGKYNDGTVFKVTPEGIETVLHSFAGASGDGYEPKGSLIQARDGNFYGTTRSTAGTQHFAGTVFKVTPAGTETVLHSFGATVGDGNRPWARLVQGRDGNFYGTTMHGGVYGKGTVFKITTAGVETVLYSFGGIKGDGRDPVAGLIQARDGNFYGTTTAGGVGGRGTVFGITPAGVEIVLHSFTGHEGYYPTASLIQAADGQLYGTTEATIFSCTLR